MLTAFDRLLPTEGPPVPVWYPAGHGDIDVPDWLRLRPIRLPGGKGHLWEQTTLARAARGTRLISLCGSGPVLQADQLVVIHDANIWDVPESFATGYRRFHGLMRPNTGPAGQAGGDGQPCGGGSVGAATWDRGGADRGGSERGRTSGCDGPGWGCAEAVRPDAGGYLLAVGNQSPNKNLARLAAAHAAAARRNVGGVPPLAIAGGMAPGVMPAALAIPCRAATVRARLRWRVARALRWGGGVPVAAVVRRVRDSPAGSDALGVPVVASRTSAMPEVLGDVPVWFDPRDVDGMATAILQVLALAGVERDLMVERGRARAGMWTWETAASRLRDLVTDEVSGRD